LRLVIDIEMHSPEDTIAKARLRYVRRLAESKGSYPKEDVVSKGILEKLGVACDLRNLTFWN
jgi:hypothetical protein